MPKYELVYIARPDLSAEAVDGLTDSFKKLLEQNGGKVVSREYWGLRNLAYKINKNSKGHYVLLNLDSPYPAVAELERIMKFNEYILRKVVFKIKDFTEGTSKLFVSVSAKDKIAN